MAVIFFTLIASALSGYAPPPNVAPALGPYGTAYPTPFNAYPTNSYGVAPGYTSAPVIPPYSIAPMYAGPNAYNTGYPHAPLGMYTPPPPPPPPVYGPAYKNSYQTGYATSVYPGPYGAGPVIPGGPVFPTGGPVVGTGPVIPTGGPVLPTGGPIPSPALVNTLTGNPAGVLPAFNNDPWAAISPMLRGAPTKQLNNSTVTTDEIDESKKAKL